MILPTVHEASLGGAALALALLAVAAYIVAAWPRGERASAIALVVAWGLHAVVLALDVSGVGGDGHGARLGFGPVLSLTVWLVLGVHEAESHFSPLPTVRRVLAAMGAVVVLVAWGFPGEIRGPLSSPWAPLHWVMGVASYALFGAAVLHAGMLDSAERQMRRGVGAAMAAPLGIPLLRLERLTFRFVEAGFIVLTLTLLMGWLTAQEWRWTHKTVFSLLGWGVFAALLAGRALRGWRGRQATRWLYAGSGLLLLAYVGTRFVFEVMLGRTAY